LPAHLSAHPSLSIPAVDAFQLRLTPLNSTPTSPCIGRPSVPDAADDDDDDDDEDAALVGGHVTALFSLVSAAGYLLAIAAQAAFDARGGGVSLATRFASHAAWLSCASAALATAAAAASSRGGTDDDDEEEEGGGGGDDASGGYGSDEGGEEGGGGEGIDAPLLRRVTDESS
jgi:hypothetical protein